jgi:clan AA aspartic protease
MIRGRVNQRLEPVVNVSTLDDYDVTHSFEFILDTGFSGHFTLPPDVIDQLGLSYSGQRAVAMADGFVHNVDVHTARVLWHGNWRPVFVIRLDSFPLLGMRSLLGSILSMNVFAGGSVAVDETF